MIAAIIRRTLAATLLATSPASRQHSIMSTPTPPPPSTTSNTITPTTPAPSSPQTSAERAFLADVRTRLILPLTERLHKGQAGRIGIVGGSFEYTGAPYFAAISALRTGMDLVHVFCAVQAGAVIKSYSPELIVHPVLDRADAVATIEPWLERLHAIVIGPGLGRDPAVLERVGQLIQRCRELSMPLIIDADGLFLVGQRPDLVYGYRGGCILTPNGAEKRRLADSFDRIVSNETSILEKGAIDRVWHWDVAAGQIAESACLPGGSHRRCGGQGDVLSGAVAAFFVWALARSVPAPEAGKLACQAASFLTRKCNERAFARHGRGMLTTDMIVELTAVFREYFE